LEDDEEDISSYWMTLRKYRVLEIERGSTRSPSVENSFGRPRGRHKQLLDDFALDRPLWRTVLEDHEEDISNYWMTLRKYRVLEIERGNTRSPSVENSFGRPRGRHKQLLDDFKEIQGIGN